MDNHKINDLISRLGSYYQVDPYESIDSLIHRLEQVYNVSAYADSDVGDSSEEYYQPSDIEAIYITKKREFDSSDVLFSAEFDEDEYINTIRKIVENEHIFEISKVIERLEIKTNLFKSLDSFSKKYTEQARKPSLDVDTASEEFTKGFIKALGSTIENLLSASMKKLAANSKDTNYRNLAEAIVNYLSYLGFIVPRFHRNFYSDSNRSIWDSNRMVPEYTGDKNQHGMICKVELFPYMVGYYDEQEEEFDKMGILGRCNIYSMEASKN